MSSNVVINWGMGADSSAILARIMTEDIARAELGVEDDYSNLIVLTAQVGHEYGETQRLGETYLLPMMAERGIRLVQVARAGKSLRDGYVVLDDSREPTQLHTAGVFTLGDEMLAGGTVPQVRPFSRTCSQKFKGEPLDRWLKAEFDGAPFVQVMGFNAEEQNRADRDDSYSGSERGLNRSTRYSLIEWGWTRKMLEDYLEAMFGEPWAKSCCTFCPFQATVEGRPEVLARIRRQPSAAAEALFIETCSTALNPLQPLFAWRGTGALGFFETAEGGEADEAFELLAEQLESSTWAVYRARRVVWTSVNSKGRKQKNGRRNLSIVAEGSEAEVLSRLMSLAVLMGGQVEQDERGHRRVWVERRDSEAQATREECYVIAPKAAIEKTGNGFAKKWEEAA